MTVAPICSRNDETIRIQLALDVEQSWPPPSQTLRGRRLLRLECDRLRQTCSGLSLSLFSLDDGKPLLWEQSALLEGKLSLDDSQAVTMSGGVSGSGQDWSLHVDLVAAWAKYEMGNGIGWQRETGRGACK